jgi:hypothetical protein
MRWVDAAFRVAALCCAVLSSLTADVVLRAADGIAPTQDASQYTVVAGIIREQLGGCVIGRRVNTISVRRRVVHCSRWDVDVTVTTVIASPLLTLLAATQTAQRRAARQRRPCRRWCTGLPTPHTALRLRLRRQRRRPVLRWTARSLRQHRTATEGVRALLLQGALGQQPGPSLARRRLRRRRL